LNKLYSNLFNGYVLISALLQVAIEPPATVDPRLFGGWLKEGSEGYPFLGFVLLKDGRYLPSALSHGRWGSQQGVLYVHRYGADSETASALDYRFEPDGALDLTEGGQHARYTRMNASDVARHVRNRR
jgi:hypothetical protein